jgi:hypothetical protein
MDRKARDNALCTVADGTMEPTRGEQKIYLISVKYYILEKFFKNKKITFKPMQLVLLVLIYFD